MKYKIEWMENTTTKNGTNLIRANIIDEGGTLIEGVTLWPKNWPDVMNGQTIDAELSITRKGQFTNRTLFPQTTYKTFAAKPNNMTKVMETKAQNIEKAQEVKHEAIKMAGAQRDAVLIVTNFYKELDDAEIKSKVEYWYKYFLDRGDSPF